jgi:hypothetical protein
MIELPRRSVTRFFIPLIDVLILMFCIYLLLPIVETRDASAAPGDPSAGGGPLSQAERLELERLRQDARRLPPALSESERAKLDALRTERIETLQKRLAIQVLEIDADTGKLYYHDPERREIASEAEARALIGRQKRESGARDLYYLFLFPRRLTGFPEERQVRQYERWFAGAAHGIDNPRASTK